MAELLTPPHSCGHPEKRRESRKSWAPSCREAGWGGKSPQSLGSRIKASGAEPHTTLRARAEIRRAQGLSSSRTHIDTKLPWGVRSLPDGRVGRGTGQ